MKKHSYVYQFLCMFLSAVVLQKTRAFFAPYMLGLILSALCLYKNSKEDTRLSGKSRYITMILSAVSAFFIVLANYGIWMYPELPDVRSPLFVRLYKLVLVLLIASGTYFGAKNILIFLHDDCERFIFSDGEKTDSEKNGGKKRAYLYFLIPFAALSVIYLVIYNSCYFPGLLSPDSIDQVRQIISGSYSNHQPFYHTMILKAFMSLGLMIFSDMNLAVSFYVVFQILFMAATFSFVVYNMDILKLPKAAKISAVIFYAVMPYHIMYSFTVWKDVYFGAFVTLMTVFFIRICKNTGKKIPNLAGFGISGLVICLIRSNGLFAYVFVFLAVLVLARKRKDVIIIMAVTIAASFVLKHPVLSAMNVAAPDTVESLSIPLQQIARVIKDGGYIADEDRAFLSEFVDVDEVSSNYDPGLSDPVKNMIRDYGNQEFLSDNIGGFLRVYLKTLVKNPRSYITSWVDMTCGYWNAGYSYWIWFWDVETNPFGITRTVRSENVLHFMDEYLWLYYNNSVLQIFTSIGLFVWILFALLYINAVRGYRTGIICMVPCLAIILSLLISTPVYSEFRYMYALFCAIPILAAISFSKKEGEE